MQPNDDLADILRSIPGFGTLDDSNLRAIASASRLQSVPENHHFYREDEASQDVYYLVSGIINITFILPDPASDPVEILTMHKGALFGTLAFLDGARRNLGAVSRERCIVVKMDGTLLRAACDANPIAGMAVYRVFGEAAARNARDVTFELRSVMARLPGCK